MPFMLRVTSFQYIPFQVEGYLQDHFDLRPKIAVQSVSRQEFLFLDPSKIPEGVSCGGTLRTRSSWSHRLFVSTELRVSTCVVSVVCWEELNRTDPNRPQETFLFERLIVTCVVAGWAFRNRLPSQLCWNSPLRRQVKLQSIWNVIPSRTLFCQKSRTGFKLFIFWSGYPWVPTAVQKDVQQFFHNFQFKVPAATSAIITNDGIGINPAQSAGKSWLVNAGKLWGSLKYQRRIQDTDGREGKCGAIIFWGWCSFGDEGESGGAGPGAPGSAPPPHHTAHCQRVRSCQSLTGRVLSRWSHSSGVVIAVISIVTNAALCFQATCSWSMDLNCDWYRATGSERCYDTDNNPLLFKLHKTDHFLSLHYVQNSHSFHFSAIVSQ